MKDRCGVCLFGVDALRMLLETEGWSIFVECRCFLRVLFVESFSGGAGLREEKFLSVANGGFFFWFMEEGSWICE